MFFKGIQISMISMKEFEAASKAHVERVLKSEAWQNRDKSDDNEIWRADITQGETLANAENLFDAINADYAAQLAGHFKKTCSILLKMGCVATAASAIIYTSDFVDDLKTNGLNETAQKWYERNVNTLSYGIGIPLGLLAGSGVFYLMGYTEDKRVNDSIARIRARRQENTIG